MSNLDGLTDEQRALLRMQTIEAIDNGFSGRFVAEMRESITRLGVLAGNEGDRDAPAFDGLLNADLEIYASEHPLVFREARGFSATYVHVSRINPDGTDHYSSSMEIGVIAGADEGKPVGAFNEDDLAFALRALREQREAGIPER